jgi:hypothetical protein
MVIKTVIKMKDGDGDGGVNRLVNRLDNRVVNQVVDQVVVPSGCVVIKVLALLIYL